MTDRFTLHILRTRLAESKHLLLQRQCELGDALQRLAVAGERLRACTVIIDICIVASKLAIQHESATNESLARCIDTALWDLFSLRNSCLEAEAYVNQARDTLNAQEVEVDRHERHLNDELNRIEESLDVKQEDLKQEDVKQEDVKQEDVKQEDVKQEDVKQE